jgi:hypothetical protein
MMSGSQGFKSVYSTLGPAGVVATIAGAVAVVVLGASLWSFTRGVLTTAPDTDAAGNVARGSEAQRAQFERHLAQINGRTMFVLPGAPAPRAPEVVAENPGPPPPPPKPTSYGGSPIIAMVLDTVWFEDGRKMKVGDAESEQTEVLAVRAPWEADLKWQGEQFTVPLFPRDRVVIKKGDSERSAGSSSLQPALASGDRPGGGFAAASTEGVGGAAGRAAGAEGGDGEVPKPAPKPVIGEKVTGPADAPVQEPEHPQVVVPRPAPGEKPQPQPIPPPPLPPQTPQDAQPAQKNPQPKAG